MLGQHLLHAERGQTDSEGRQKSGRSNRRTVGRLGASSGEFIHLAVVQTNGVSCNLGSLHSLLDDMLLGKFLLLMCRTSTTIFHEQRNNSYWFRTRCSLMEREGLPAKERTFKVINTGVYRVPLVAAALRLSIDLGITFYASIRTNYKNRRNSCQRLKIIFLHYFYVIKFSTSSSR